MYESCYSTNVIAITVQYAGQDILARIGQSALCRLAFLIRVSKIVTIQILKELLLSLFSHYKKGQGLYQKWQFHIYFHYLRWV